jgi:CubicO group peptidase (beta-lactamase class C family)
MKLQAVLLTGIFLAACSSSDNNPAATPTPESPPDFAPADAWLHDFVANNEAFSGASLVIVDKSDGAIHKAIFGDHTANTSVLLASTSKVPTVTLLMALHEDDRNVDFEIDSPIANYLPWLGVWDQGITTEHLLANRSGIPGLENLLIDRSSYRNHNCQYLPFGSLLQCVQTIYQSPLPTLTSNPPDTAFDYGGSQWTLAAGVAETVGGANWQQLWDQYVGEPCGLEVFRYGNMLSSPTAWDGNPDSLIGIENPNVEGGAISDIDDYAKLIAMHLNDGACGSHQVLSAEAVAFMRRARTAAEGDTWGYGMGWWIIPPKADDGIYLYVDPGFYGSISWIDVKREYGGVVLFEEYTGKVSRTGSQGVVNELIPLIEAAIDAANH